MTASYTAWLKLDKIFFEVIPENDQPVREVKCQFVRANGAKVTAMALPGEVNFPQKLLMVQVTHVFRKITSIRVPSGMTMHVNNHQISKLILG